MIPLMGNVQNRQIHRHREWVHDCQGLRRGWCAECLTGTVSNLEDEEVPGRWRTGGEWLHNSVNVLNVTELCT